jgi:hypothetical protein
MTRLPRLMAVLDGLDLYEGQDYERHYFVSADTPELWFLGLRAIIYLVESPPQSDAWLVGICQAQDIQLIEVGDAELDDPVTLGNRLGAALFTDDIPIEGKRK